MSIRSVITISLLWLVFASAAQAETLCTTLADAATGQVLKQDGRCDMRVTPASTFKIAISLIGFDSGFLVDEHHPVLAFRDGYADWNPAWRQPTDPARWIRYSVVWFSQVVTRHLGEARFSRYVKAFRYGNEDVSGDPEKYNGLTHAWLSSSLRISPLEQLAFLEKVVRRQLPVSARAYDMTDRITFVAQLPNGWEVHGKTGTGSPIDATGAKDLDHDYGWFVGWARKGQRAIVFARLGEENATPAALAASVPLVGLRVREATLEELPEMLDSAAK